MYALREDAYVGPAGGQCGKGWVGIKGNCRRGAKGKAGGRRMTDMEKARSMKMAQSNRTARPTKAINKSSSIVQAARERSAMLRAKFGSKEAVRQQFTGKDSFRQAVGMGKLKDRGSDRVQGAVTRGEINAVERTLSRKARRTGKDVNVRRNLNYDPTGSDPDIQNNRFTGSAKKGGDDRYGQRAAKKSRTSASGDGGFEFPDLDEPKIAASKKRGRKSKKLDLDF